jgi:hypothetical protein
MNILLNNRVREKLQKVGFMDLPLFEAFEITEAVLSGMEEHFAIDSKEERVREVMAKEVVRIRATVGLFTREGD